MIEFFFVYHKFQLLIVLHIMSAQLLVEYAEQLGNQSINWDYNGDTLHVNNVKLDIIDNNVTANNDILSQHVVRLIKLNTFDENDFICDLIMILNELIPNIYDKCTICGEHILSQNIVDTCGNIDCVNQSLKLVTNNYVCDYFNRDENVFMLLVYTAYSCLKHPNAQLVMIPFPKLSESIAELSNILKYDISNINNLIEIISNAKNDNDLQKKLGKTEYGFLKFVLKTNNTNLMSSKLFDKNNFENVSAFSSHDVICYDVRHEPFLENKFGSSELRYLFHGSSLANWYAILRNGLKNCSGTKLMAHGAAYGSGVYLSDSASVSFSYGGDKYTRIGTSVVGVVQVIGNTLKDNNNKIFVEPNDENLLLRYVLLIKNSNKCEEITKYFTQKLVYLSNKSNPLVAKVVSKRLIHDSKSMVTIVDKHGWKIDCVNDIWTIKVSDTIELCIKFNQNYPITPPFLWLNSTCFMSKDVTKYGAVFLNELVPKNWIISTKISNVIEKFILDLQSGIKTQLVNFNYDTAFNDYSTQLKIMQLV